jgi:ubiquinol-cytochrome c reductase cytochrome c subunit
MRAAPAGRYRRRRLDYLFVLAVLAAAALVASAGGQVQRTGGDGVAGTSHAPEPVALLREQQFEEGERVFLRDCAWCHGNEGKGSERGPSLEDAGPAAAHFQLTTGRMPLESDEDEPERGTPAYPPVTVDALVTYVGTLGTGPEVPKVLPGDAARGRTLFLYNCAPCHSSGATGMILPQGDFASELLDSTPTQVAEAVRLGPGPMPPFSDRQLDKEQVDAIAAYVEQLGPHAAENQDIGGHPLDRLGPIFEGAVAWLLGIPALLLVIRLLGKRSAAKEEG